MLKELAVPVYGSDLTCNVLKFHLQRFKVRGKEECFNVINAKDVLDFGTCQVEVFQQQQICQIVLDLHYTHQMEQLFTRGLYF